ncbi:Uncharacterized protein KIAA1671 [Colius striatus]|uniref:Uncharacterized protein KIAA1671 n=1 Tax=Colius striatus TaxID=57412 RepID=A0A091JWU4_COLST|nr:Uncharacterized protein KIAA1671 [Colius striatus]
MATRIEINSTLASLTAVPDLNEIRNEDKSQRVYVSVLSDASIKTKEASASLALEEKSMFGSTLRSATMPSLGSRPRLFPKPFSKEKSSDTFANVKPPVPAFRSSSLIRKATEETSPVKVLSGNVPPLVDQKVIENKAGSEVVTNVTFCAGPSANTVILFEATGTEQSKVSLAQEKRAADDRRVFSTVQTKELQCNAKLEKPSQQPETPRSPEGSLRRQMSLSSSLRPVSWNSLKTGEKKHAHEDHPGEKNSDDANNINSKVDFSIDVQQRPKHRPVSAIFLESLRDQKDHSLETSEEKSPTEKSSARKPRPLSMDLTAKFEHKDLSSCKTYSSQESKENVSIVSFADGSCHSRLETGPKTLEPECNKGSSSKTTVRCSGQDIGILNNGKYLWETKLKSKTEQTETKPEIVTNLHASERSHETISESRTDKGARRPDQKETLVFPGCESPTASSETENNIVRGSVKKHISLFTSEHPGPSVDTELLLSPAERESRCVSIQQRIKELTTEPADLKPGNPRRSLQSRPLSADLTKMFSSPTSSSAAKAEKPAETRNDSVTEMQENRVRKGQHQICGIMVLCSDYPFFSLSIVLALCICTSKAQLLAKSLVSVHTESEKMIYLKTLLHIFQINCLNCGMFLFQSKEVKLAHGTDFTEARAAGSPWKPRQILKITNKPDQTERKGNFLGDGQHFSQSESSVSYTSNLEKPLKSSTLPEKVCVKTVRATMFDHNVQRHNIAADQPGTDSALKMNHELEVKHDVVTLGHSRRSWMGEVEEATVFTSKSELREPNGVFSSECTLPEQRKDSDKTETDPMLTPYSTNKKMSDVLKCTSERRSFRPGGTESYEFRTHFDPEVMSKSLSKHEPQPSSVLSSGQFCKSSSSHHLGTKVLTVNKEESRAFGLRSPDFNCKEQGFDLHSTAHENSEKIRAVDTEEKVRRSRSSVSDLRISERWRRRTLPQDSVKTENVVWLAPENIRRLSQMDSLQLDEGSVKKRSTKSKEGLEGNETNQTAPGSPDDCLKNQSSAFEPKATYFAVTYQVPGNKREKSFVGTTGANEANTISSSREGTTINLDPVFPGRSKPLLQQPNKNVMSTNCKEDSQEVPVHQNWGRGDDKGDSLSKNIAFSNFHGSRKGNQQCHERGLDDKEKMRDADAFLLNQDLENTVQTDLKSSRRKVSSFHEPRSPLCFAQFHRDSEPGPQNRSGNSCGFSGKKSEDGYRSQILDIDALMAEYKEEAAKASNTQDKVSEDHSSFSREKPKTKSNHYSVNSKQGDCTEDYYKPEQLVLNEKSKEKPESCSPEFEKQKSKDRKFIPPYWGNPSSSSEKCVNSPLELSRKKTFIVDEDEEVNLTSRNQSSQFIIDKVEPINAGGTDQRWEVSFASKMSIKSDDGFLQKKLVTKEQFFEVSPEGDWSKTVARSSVTRTKDNASRMSCENDSAHVKSKTDWKNYTSGLGSAPPDLRRSYSEKSRQGKDNLQLMQEVRGRKDLSRARQSFPLERVDSEWKHRTSSRSESFFHDDKKASRKEWTKPSSDKPDRTDSSLVSTLRSCHSFYKDRRADMDQLKQCFTRQPPGAKDTDTLVQEPDSQYGTWNEQRHSGDSFVPESPSSENNVISTRKQPPGSHPSSLSSQTEPASLVDHHDFSKDQRSTSLDRSSTDMDSTDGTDLPPLGDTCPDEKTTDFSFIDQTTILDSSALKTRVQLSKKRRRRAPVSHSVRRSRGLEFENRFSLTEEPDNTWMFKDSTEEKKTMQQEDSDEEDKTQRTARSSSVHAQRLPVFPGMDHSALKAQLRKRQESESPGEVSSAQLFRSPKGTPGSKVLPTSAEREDRSEEKSPQWLKELKSKKRQSHYENQV